ncbi:unnamed protein product [Trichobilharzia regenti]|nr:unnamed protein product [Trichobilharzia regenti]
MNKSVSDSNCPAMKKENNNDDDDDDNTTPTTTTTAATTTSLPNKNFSVHECHKQDPDDCQQRQSLPVSDWSKNFCVNYNYDCTAHENESSKRRFLC